MIEYLTYCAIHDHHTRRGLNAAQIAEALDLDPSTVTAWLAEPRFRPRRSSPRASKRDSHKPTIRRWLEQHRFSAQQVFQRLREEEGNTGGISILKDYGRQVRPPRTSAFLTLAFGPGSAPRSIGALGRRSRWARRAGACRCSSWCSATAACCTSSSL